MIRAVLLSLALATSAAQAEVVVALAVIPAGSVLSSADLALAPGDVPDALRDPRDAIGLEARVTLYPSRPIREQDLGAPTVVERNAIVPLVYAGNGLRIATEGRALGRAGAGETVRVMNIASRTTVMGVATEAGTVEVR